MNRNQIAFLLLAFIHLLLIVFLKFSEHQFMQSVSVIPGWHMTLENHFIFQKPVIILYFLAVSLLYGTESNLIPRWFFLLHFILSFLPAVYVLGIVLDTAPADFYFISLLEDMFVYSQLFFMLGMFYFRKRKTKIAEN